MHTSAARSCFSGPLRAAEAPQNLSKAVRLQRFSEQSSGVIALRRNPAARVPFGSHDPSSQAILAGRDSHQTAARCRHASPWRNLRRRTAAASVPLRPRPVRHSGEHQATVCPRRTRFMSGRGNLSHSSGKPSRNMPDFRGLTQQAQTAVSRMLDQPAFKFAAF